jgi:phage terminase Nu1 subunit (DNA packaging protein)
MAHKALTLKQLATGCKVSVRTLNTWLQRGCPRHSITAALAWRDKHVLPRKGGPRKRRPITAEKETEQQSLLARRIVAQCEKDEAIARREKIKSDMLAGTVVEKVAVVREAAEICSAARAILDAIPDAIAKELPEESRVRAYEVAKNKVDAAFRKLADLRPGAGGADGA